MGKEKKLARIQIILCLVLYIMGSYLPNYRGVDIRLVVGVLWTVFIFIYHYKIPKLAIREKSAIRSQMYLLAFNVGVVTLILSIGAGILLGFGKNPANTSLIGIIGNLIYIVPMLIGREIVHCYTLCSYRKKNPIGLVLLVTVFFSLTEINMNKCLRIQDAKDLVILLTEYIAPIVCKQLFLTILVMYSGIKSSLIYLGMLSAFEWVSPILPNLPWLGTGVIGVVIPIIGIIIATETYKRLTRQIKRREVKEQGVLGYLVPSVMVVAVLWFIVGVFTYYPSAIVTGSMMPLIQPGDVVIIHKLTSVAEVKTLQVGDIIQFEREGLMINHRIIEIKEVDGQTLYCTKGDHNNVADTPLVEMEEIRGRIIQIVPKVGWPSVWLHTVGMND